MMFGTPVDVRVKVFLHPDTDPPFHFESDDLSVGLNNELTFVNNHRHGFRIHYDLQDPTHGFLFPGKTLPDHLNEAVYVKPHAPCPQTKSKWGQFTPERVDNGGKTLVVWNKNESPVKFGYTLRVINSAGQWLPLDPTGDNQNGPTSPFVNYLAVGAIAVTTGGLSALATVLVARPLFCS